MESTQTKTAAEIENTVRTGGKNIAIISYITLFGLAIAFIMNHEKKNEFARYHIRQSLGLLCLGLAMSLINLIPILGFIMSFLGMLVLAYFWIVGLLNAINEKKVPVPFIGVKFEEWFKNV